MARLTHNDYLEQASDSGLPGFVAYALAIGGVLAWSGRRAMRDGGQFFAVWLGVLAWALQSFVEFGLYIPALSWLAFALLGWKASGTRSNAN
jgi:O-antigen ligase